MRVEKIDPEDAENAAFDLKRQSVRLAIWASAAIMQRIQSAFLVPVENLVARDPRDVELPAHHGHLLALDKAG